MVCKCLRPAFDCSPWPALLVRRSLNKCFVSRVPGRDRCLYTIAEEQATRSAAISSTSAQMMLTDLLFMALVQQDLERAPERIRHSEELVKKLV